MVGWGFGLELGVELHQSDTGIPPKNRVVVSRWANPFGRLVAVQGLAQPFTDDVLWSSLLKQSTRPPFVSDAGVVGPFIFADQSACDALAFAEPNSALASKLIRKRQKKHTGGILIFRIHFENVAADARRLIRLIEKPIALAKFERMRYRLFVNPFEFHLSLIDYRRLNSLNSFASGS